MALEKLGKFRAAFVRRYSPLHRDEAYYAVLPKLSQAGMSIIRDNLIHKGLALHKERESKLIFEEKATGRRLTVMKSGIAIGADNPLNYLAPALPGLIQTRREAKPAWTTVPHTFLRSSYFTLFREDDGCRLVMTPRIEAKGRVWQQLRRNYTSALASDELFVATRVIEFLEPVTVVGWLSSSLDKAEAYATKSGIFFRAQFSLALFLELAGETAKHLIQSGRYPRCLVPPPDMTLRLAKPRGEITGKILAEIYDDLGEWCQEPSHLIAASP